MNEGHTRFISKSSYLSFSIIFADNPAGRKQFCIGLPANSFRLPSVKVFRVTSAATKMAHDFGANRRAANLQPLLCSSFISFFILSPHHTGLF